MIRPNVVIYDHVFKTEYIMKNVGYVTKPIII